MHCLELDTDENNVSKWVVREGYSRWILQYITTQQLENNIPLHWNIKIERKATISKDNIFTAYLYCSHLHCGNQIRFQTDLKANSDILTITLHSKLDICQHGAMLLAPTPNRPPSESNYGQYSDFGTTAVQEMQQVMQPSMKPGTVARIEAAKASSAHIVSGSALTGNLDKNFHYNQNKNQQLPGLITDPHFKRIYAISKLQQNLIKQDADMFNIEINSTSKRYLGCIHDFHLDNPFRLSIYHISSFKLLEHFGYDMFIDFTGLCLNSCTSNATQLLFYDFFHRITSSTN